MNWMAPGNNMKPQYTVDIAGSAAAYAAAPAGAAKDSVDTHPIVRFNGDMIAQLNWAARQGFRLRGHTLVWHAQTPPELFRSGYSTGLARMTKARMILRMDFYIREIIRLIHESWPGVVAAMDVVNEAIDDNSGAVRTSGNEWYTTFGDTTYVMKAFELTRQYTTQYGETQIKLYYNDYGTENARKADGIVRVCAPIFQAGFLDGIGMQEHNNMSTPSAETFIASYNKFDPICSEMSITELDVATGTGTPSAAILARQANQYGMLVKCFVERSFGSGRGKIVNVSKDGLNDQYTFQTNQASSLWDTHNQCKPAFFAVVGVGVKYNALDSLVRFADTVQQAGFTPDSWSRFTAGLTMGRNARDRNYSNSVSADTALGVARDTLQAAINGLERIVGGVDVADGIPESFSLGQNYPNPFNPATVIQYGITESEEVKLTVVDLLGREVALLVNERKPAGRYEVSFDGGGLPSGVYLYRLTAGSRSESRKMVLLR
jgi:GH35 family endo-1,4-beta-xylanase